MAGSRTSTRHNGKVVVLSDLHMVPEGDTIIGIDPHQRLASAVAHINRHHADADRLVVLGDLAQGGDAVSYLRVKDLLDELVPPVSLMVGNHDHRPTFIDVFAARALPQDGFIQGEVATGAYRLVMLDTVVDPDVDGVHGSAGYLCERRLRWLDQRLAAAGGAPVVLFMHHPPMATGFPGMDRIRLHNADDLLRILRRHANVRQIVAGHIHRTISGSWHGIPFAVFKSPVHQQPLDFRSASTSLSVDEPGAYGVLLLTPTGVVVHTEDYELAAITS